VCDFANKKVSRVLLCPGFPINEEAFKDAEYPPYMSDPVIIRKVIGKESQDNIIASLKKRYVLGNEELGENFYTLWNFKIGGKFVDLFRF